MNTKYKKKLCWNCEGVTSLDEENCLYCGVYLHALPSENEEEVGEREEANTVPPPPYRLVAGGEEERMHASPYTRNSDQKEQSAKKNTNNAAKEKIFDGEEGELATDIAYPLVLLLSGSVFLLFSIALFLFSQNGVLTLQWNGEYWFIYLLSGTTMLLFGWSILQKKQGKEE